MGSTSETDRVMLDIETLGTGPGAAIVSIGAVRFDEAGLGDEFYRSIHVESCDDAGLSIDADTLHWWLMQDDTVKHVLTGGITLQDALTGFTGYYNGADEVWAFSPAFDCDILSAAYDALDLKPPWTYRDERCARTIDALPLSERPEPQGDAHNALDDARNQARMVSDALARMQEVKTRV